MCETEEGAGRGNPVCNINENMLDFFLLMDNFKGIFTNEREQTKRFMNPNLTLFIIIIVIIIVIVIQIIYFHCLFFLLLYHLDHNMDTVIPVMNIFLAKALSLSWSTFILVRNKEIKFIIPSAPSIQYPLFNI